MQRIVIDANISLAWLLNEPSAAQIVAILSESTLVAPWLWRLEVTNAILVQERRKLLTEADVFDRLQLIDRIKIEIVSEPTERAASALAAASRLRSRVNSGRPRRMARSR